MTQAELEKRLDMIKYYDVVIDQWQRCVNDYPYIELSPHNKIKLAKEIRQNGIVEVKRYNG